MPRLARRKPRARTAAFLTFRDTWAFLPPNPRKASGMPAERAFEDPKKPVITGIFAQPAGAVRYFGSGNLDSGSSIANPQRLLKLRRQLPQDRQRGPLALLSGPERGPCDRRTLRRPPPLCVGEARQRPRRVDPRDTLEDRRHWRARHRLRPRAEQLQPRAGVAVPPVLRRQPGRRGVDGADEVKPEAGGMREERA